MANIIVTTENELQTIVQNAVNKALNGTNQDTSLLINSGEVMTMCKISHTTLQKWRNNGKIPFTKIDNKILYNKADVLTALYNNQ